MRSILTDVLGEDLETRTLDRLEECAVSAHHRQNEIIYQQGSKPDGIYFIGHGFVLLERASLSGFVTAFRLASGGECFGYRSFCGNEPRSTAARSLTASLTLRVHGPVVDRAMADDSGLGRVLARLLARDEGPKISRTARNARIPVRTRLAYVLAEMTQHLPSSASGEGRYFEFPLSQKDLSNLLDVSPETISRNLHEFENTGLLAIKHGPRRLLVSDWAGLAEIADAAD